jgi:SAM-dependent methyltransferase
VRPWVNRFFLADELALLPSSHYDLAISHLTAQHMTDEDLREQIREVTRALKVGGIFSLHLAGSRISGEDNIEGPIPEGFDGRMCRSPEYTLEMMLKEVPSRGRKYEFHLLDKIMEWPEFKSYWHWIHVRREA